MEKWTCRGSVRGECGIAHQTREAAERCIAADHRACVSQGGYSDRVPVRLDTDDGMCAECEAPLVWDDYESQWMCQDRGYTVGHGTAESVREDEERSAK